MNNVSGRNGINNHSKTLKKYSRRNLPPYPANENCDKKKKGNDGLMYVSKPNKNGVCSWKKRKRISPHTGVPYTKSSSQLSKSSFGRLTA